MCKGLLTSKSSCYQVKTSFLPSTAWFPSSFKFSLGCVQTCPALFLQHGMSFPHNTLRSIIHRDGLSTFPADGAGAGRALLVLRFKTRSSWRPARSLAAMAGAQLLLLFPPKTCRTLQRAKSVIQGLSLDWIGLHQVSGEEKLKQMKSRKGISSLMNKNNSKSSFKAVFPKCYSQHNTCISTAIWWLNAQITEGTNYRAHKIFLPSQQAN